MVLQTIKGVLRQVLLHVFYFFSFSYVKDKKLWIYGGVRDRFIDNAKYLFLYNNKHLPEIQHVWMSKSEKTRTLIKGLGFQSYDPDSQYGRKLLRKAGVIVFDLYPYSVGSPYQMGGSYLFNLWHGVPLKKIEYDIHSGPFRKIYNPKGLKERVWQFSYHPKIRRKTNGLLATSPRLKPYFSSAFNVPEDNICVGMYPRVSPLIWSESELRRHIDTIETKETRDLVDQCSKFNECWIYMPTFREGDDMFLEKALPDLNRLNEILKQEGILFLLKVHRKTVLPKANSQQFSHILFLDPDIDIYPVLPYTDCLVTDYSSIYFDYAILAKRMVFYPIDLQSYLSKSRDLNFKYEKMMEGQEIVYSFNDFIDKLTIRPGKDKIVQRARAFEPYYSKGDLSEINHFIMQKAHIQLSS